MMTTRALEDNEIKVIFENVEGYNAKRNEVILICGIGMALRASELVGLNVGDVFDGEQVKTHVTIRGETAKFNKNRSIRLWDIVHEKLKEFIYWKVDNRESIKPKAPLFWSREGGHLTTKALYYLVKNIFEAAGIDQSPHCLRKTGGTIFYEESDYDLIATQLFLGHADPSTTRKYIGVPNKKTIETCQRSSIRLARLIGETEFTSNLQMVNSILHDVTTAELILELQARGIDMSSAIEQMQAERKQKEKGKVILFPKSKTG
jgi:integrase